MLLEKLKQGSSRIISSPDHEFAIGLDPELNLAQKFELNCEKRRQNAPKQNLRRRGEGRDPQNQSPLG